MIIDQKGYETAVEAVREMDGPELFEYLDGLYGRESLPRSITIELLREEALLQTKRVFGPDYERLLFNKKAAFRQALIPSQQER